MGVMRLWDDGKMEKLKNIFGMNAGTDGVEAGSYEGALIIAQRALNNMG